MGVTTTRLLVASIGILLALFMNSYFQARGRGTGPLCLPNPHPDMSEANVCFQASRSQAKERFTRALLVQYFHCASARINHAQALKHGQFAYGHSSLQLEAHVGTPFPDTHFAHQLTLLLHTRGRPFILVHTR